MSTSTPHADAVAEARTRLEQTDADPRVRRGVARPGVRDPLIDRLMAAEVMLRKMEEHPRELTVESIVSRSDRRPRVDVTWRGTLIQMDPDEAKSTAAIFVQAAEIAQLEADLAVALEKLGHIRADVVGYILGDLRLIRESRKGGH